MKTNYKLGFFDDFYFKYIDDYKNRVRQLEDKLCIGKLIYPSIEKYIQEELVSLSRMTFIFELNYHRECNLLKGESSEERYENFCEMTGSIEFHKYIEQNYPVLVFLFEQRLQHVMLCLETIVTSYLREEKEIEELFGLRFKDIVDIEIGCGDIHKCGETIAVLKSNIGKLVYKGHDLYNDVALNKVLRFLNASGKIKHSLKESKVLCKSDHGWQEFIEVRECKDNSGVARYYYRLGSQLAIFYVLNSGDMHYENILAEGEFPRIVDTETLVTCSKLKKIDENWSYHNFSQDNVISSCLLPLNDKRGQLDVNLCGLTGGDIRSNKIKDLTIENYGTDRMKLVRHNIECLTAQTNIPRIKGVTVNVLEWKKDFMDGFEDAMNVFRENKDILLDYIMNSEIRVSRQRQLFRNTYAYAVYLETGCHPSNLVSFEKRKQLFDKLSTGDNKGDKRIAHEISLLNEGYIPAYYSHFEGCDLFSNGELIQKNFFSQSGKNTVRYKIATLCPETIRLQKHIINLSYMTMIKDLMEAPTEIESNNYYLNYLDGAKVCIENISQNWIVNPETGEKDLFIVKLGKAGPMLQSVDLTLYEGGGLIWAMYCYAKEINNQELIDLSVKLVEAAENTHSQMMDSEPLSIYSGMGSVLYILYNFYLDTGKSSYFELLEKYLNKISERIDTLVEIDYMHGISGYIVLLSNIIKKGNQNELIKKLFKKSIDIFDKLLRSYKPKTFGLAHGGTGVAVALSHLYYHTQDRKYMMRIEDILEDEIKYVDSENIFWCRGTGGYTQGLAEILCNLGDTNCVIYENIYNKFEICLKILLDYEYKKTDNVCVCHGLYGHYEVLATMKNQYIHLLPINLQESLSNHMRIIENNLVGVTEKKLWLKSEYVLETFMLGSSGPAYTMVRLHNSKYPSFLNLEMI